MTTTDKVNLALIYGMLTAKLALWLAAAKLAGLVSREAAQINAELKAAGDCIEPLKPIIAELDVLHAELFGDEE